MNKKKINLRTRFSITLFDSPMCQSITMQQPEQRTLIPRYFKVILNPLTVNDVYTR